MKNSSYYIQYQQTSNKPTKAERIRNILWYLGQVVGGIMVFAMMYAIIIIATAF